jgi:hypothetical protein
MGSFVCGHTVRSAGFMNLPGVAIQRLSRRCWAAAAGRDPYIEVDCRWICLDDIYILHIFAHESSFLCWKMFEACLFLCFDTFAKVAGLFWSLVRTALYSLDCFLGSSIFLSLNQSRDHRVRRLKQKLGIWTSNAIFWCGLMTGGYTLW